MKNMDKCACGRWKNAVAPECGACAGKRKGAARSHEQAVAWGRLGGRPKKVGRSKGPVEPGLDRILDDAFAAVLGKRSRP